MKNSGLFVALEQSGAEGLVHIASLLGQGFRLDASKQILTNNDQEFELGNGVTVSLTGVDLSNSQMNVERQLGLSAAA